MQRRVVGRAINCGRLFSDCNCKGHRGVQEDNHLKTLPQCGILFFSNCDKRREKFWPQLCIRRYTGKAGESVPERVDELWVVGDEGGGELALLLPAARRVDQHLHLGVVKPVELVPTAPNVELVEILKIMISEISESEELPTLT